MPSQAKPSQAKVLTEGVDLREAQVVISLSVSHSCVDRIAGCLTDTLTLTGDVLSLTIWSLAEGLD
jgi:hypothetical protein